MIAPVAQVLPSGALIAAKVNIGRRHAAFGALPLASVRGVTLLAGCALTILPALAMVIVAPRLGWRL